MPTYELKSADVAGLTYSQCTELYKKIKADVDKGFKILRYERKGLDNLIQVTNKRGTPMTEGKFLERVGAIADPEKKKRGRPPKGDKS